MDTPFYQSSGKWIKGLPVQHYKNSDIKLSFNGASVSSTLSTMIRNDNTLEYIIHSKEGSMRLGKSLPSRWEVMESMHLMDYVKTKNPNERYWKLFIGCRDVSGSKEKAEKIVNELNHLVSDFTSGFFFDIFSVDEDQVESTGCFFIYWYVESEKLTEDLNTMLHSFVVNKLDEMDNLPEHVLFTM